MMRSYAGRKTRDRLITAILLLCALMLPLFVSCAPEQPSPSPDTPTPTVTPSAQPSPEPKPATLIIYANESESVRDTFETLIYNFWDTDLGKIYRIVFKGESEGISFRLGSMALSGHTSGTDYDMVLIGEDGMRDAYLGMGGDQLSDMFLPIDTARLTNLDNLLTGYDEPSRGYGVPIYASAVVLAYNREAVANVPKTFSEIYDWIRANPGRFAYTRPEAGSDGFDFALTAVYQFLPDDAILSGDEAMAEQWRQGWDFLTELHPYLYARDGKVYYPEERELTLDLLGSEEIDMCTAWSGELLNRIHSRGSRSEVRVTTVSPGYRGSLMGLALPVIGHCAVDEDVLAAAYAFMDYVLSPAGQDILVGGLGALPLVDTRQLDAGSYLLFGTTDLMNFRNFIFGPLNMLFKQTWNEKILPLCDSILPNY